MAANTKNGKYSLETKRKVVDYYNENQVPRNIEDLLNRMYQENPTDIYGYMAEYFGKLSKPPTISKITCGKLLSSRGYTTFHVALYCTINGIEKFVSSIVASVDSFSNAVECLAAVKSPDLKNKTPESQPSVTTGLDITDSDGEITEAITRIESIILPVLRGICPDRLQAVDEVLSNLQEKENTSKSKCKVDGKPDSGEKSTVPELVQKPSTLLSSNKGQTTASKKEPALVVPDLEGEQVYRDYASLSVSMVTALAGASLFSCPLYEFLSRTEHQVSEKRFLPVPVMTVLSSGKWAAGKQNMIKEIMICSQPEIALKEGLQQLINIYHQLGNITIPKGGALKCTTEKGGFSPVLDKPEQALDLVVEAVNACGLSLGTDVHMIISCAATDFYDQEKQKYEVIANGFKTTDDLINMYCDFYEKYPGLLGIIDGIRAADKDGWIKLNKRLGEKCYIIGGDIYGKHPSVLSSAIKEKISSGAVLSLDHGITLTGVINKANTIHEQGGLVVMSNCPPEDTSTLVVDMAVSVGARFMILSGPVRSEHVAKYRRLETIEEELQKNDKMLPQQPHVFPVVNEPEPGSEDEAEKETIQ